MQLCVMVLLLASACSDVSKHKESPEPQPSSPAPSAPPSSPAPAKERPTPQTAPDVEKSKCFKVATKLLKMARGCGIDVGDRSANKTCTELFTVDSFSDEQATGRLEIFMRDGCAKLRLAIENDRV
jgi:hypothetical protein